MHTFSATVDSLGNVPGLQETLDPTGLAPGTVQLNMQVRQVSK